jgi:hypothetical protein
VPKAQLAGASRLLASRFAGTGGIPELDILEQLHPTFSVGQTDADYGAGQVNVHGRADQGATLVTQIRYYVLRNQPNSGVIVEKVRIRFYPETTVALDRFIATIIQESDAVGLGLVDVSGYRLDSQTRGALSTGRANLQSNVTTGLFATTIDFFRIAAQATIERQATLLVTLEPGMSLLMGATTLGIRSEILNVEWRERRATG